MNELIMDELYFDTQHETALRVEKMLKERFRQCYGPKGEKILEDMLAYATAPGRGTPVRLIITPHPTYKSKYLPQS